MKKVFITFLLVVVAALSLVACSDDKSENTGKEESGSDIGGCYLTIKDFRVTVPTGWQIDRTDTLVAIIPPSHSKDENIIIATFSVGDGITAKELLSDDAEIPSDAKQSVTPDVGVDTINATWLDDDMIFWTKYFFVKDNTAYVVQVKHTKEDKDGIIDILDTFSFKN